MFIIAGNQVNNKFIKIENFTRQCKNCGNHTYHKITEQDNKATLFFVPLVTWSKKYYRTCTTCGITVEINKEDIV